MKTEDLKTGFWGYQKFSVMQYITALEAEYSAKLLEKDQESHRLLEQEKQRVHQLEEELADLRRKYEAQEREQHLISSTLMEAQRYAELMKAQSEERQQAAQQQLEEALELREQAMQRYDARLEQLREQFRSMLREMDEAAEGMSQELAHARAEAPDNNMSMFCRRPELVV